MHSYKFCYLLQLKDYAYTHGHGIFNERPTSGGYTLSWKRTEEQQFGKDTKKSEIFIPAILILIACFVALSVGCEVLTIASEKCNDRNSHYYYLFWSFQFLAALINGLHTWYNVNIHIVHVPIAIVILALAFINSVVLYIVYGFSKQRVPFTKSPVL